MAKNFFLNKKIKPNGKPLIVQTADAGAWQKFYQEETFVKPTPNKSRFNIIILIISLLMNILASFAICLLFFSGYFSESKLFTLLKIDSFLPTSNIVIERQEQTIVQEDERISNVIEALLPSIVNIFSYSETNSQNFILNQSKNYVGTGVVLTNDGWLVIGSLLRNSGEYVAIQDNGNVLRVVDIKEDANLGVSFLKVAAENLPTVALVKRSAVNPGTSALLISGLSGHNRTLFLTRISDNRMLLNDNALWESENNYLFLSLDKSKITPGQNGPVFSLNKELIGFNIENANFSYILPVDYFKKSFNQLLTLKVSKPTYLGLVYINLANNFVENQPRKGALITAVKNDSPLKKLNLAAGDIILKVNDDLLNEINNLSNLIQDYRPGDKIKLTVLNKNDQKERVVEVILK